MVRARSPRRRGSGTAASRSGRVRSSADALRRPTMRSSIGRAAPSARWASRHPGPPPSAACQTPPTPRPRVHPALTGPECTQRRRGSVAPGPAGRAPPRSTSQRRTSADTGCAAGGPPLGAVASRRMPRCRWPRRLSWRSLAAEGAARILLEQHRQRRLGEARPQQSLPEAGQQVGIAGPTVRGEVGGQAHVLGQQQLILEPRVEQRADPGRARRWVSRFVGALDGVELDPCAAPRQSLRGRPGRGPCRSGR